MALVKCGECGKAVSDKANTCPACGNPMTGGSSSAVGVLLEKRVELYKANKYRLIKREGDTVILEKTSAGLIIGLVLFVIYAVILGLLNVFFTTNLLTTLVITAGFLGLNYMCQIQSRVNISITKAGKIEETGYTLKKKK